MYGCEQYRYNSSGSEYAHIRRMMSQGGTDLVDAEFLAKIEDAGLYRSMHPNP